ncbi:MAG: flagellar filament capping protein FliD [Spirochaetes bacterium]|nr:flagellar filament capping protein FliD [Spirochaetota bacterium]
MSDITIPGVTSKVDTKKIIDALMEVERQPLKRMQADADLLAKRKTAWQDFNRSLTTLREGTRGLYGFENPFNDRIVDSSDAKAITATATRQAIDETLAVAVRRVATADRFLSRSLGRDFAVDAGNYVFSVGGKEIKLAYSGGSLKDFAEALTRKGGEHLRASVVNDTKETQVLLIESKKTGAENRLVLSGAAADLGVKTGMLERRLAASREITLTERGVAAWSKTLDPSQYKLTDGVLTLEPGAELKVPVQPSVALDERMVLELSVKVELLSEEAAAAPPTGPRVPETGSIEFGGVRIESGRSEAPLPEWEAPKKPEKVSDPQVLFLESGGKLVALPGLADSGEFQKITIEVGKLAGSIDSLDLRNRNTHRRISITDVALVDVTQRGDYVPVNAVSEAADAVLSLDGIEVTRPSNVIDDVVPGVTLTLKAPSKDPVDLTVHRDAKAIKDTVLSLVGAYNRIITDVDVLTRKDAAVIAEAGYLTDEEKKKATERLGLLTGETMLTNLKASMQQIMMNAYPTSRSRDLALLAQIGIATDLRRPGSGVDKTRLRGYLEADEAKLENAIASMPDAIRELFGNDTDGDLVVNTGVAYSLDALLRPFVQTGGILPNRVTGTDTQIARSAREISDYEKRLTAKEAELKRKYGLMESALNEMDKNSQTLKNFTNSTSNNGN